MEINSPNQVGKDALIIMLICIGAVLINAYVISLL